MHATTFQASRPATGAGFICSVCGHFNAQMAEPVHRELMACAGCGANMRFRAIACAIALARSGQVGALSGLSPDRGCRAIGISDATNYAAVLEGLFDYTNTFLHTEPRLDIEDAASFERFGALDLIVCSDVIEHTLRPPSMVLVNLAQALKPGGHLVLSAPTFLMPDTVERYPSLEGFDVKAAGGGAWEVHYRTRFGTHGVDAAPVFHGGPGRVLELRVISHPQLLHELRAAGLELLPIAEAELQRHGALWPGMVERQDLPLPLDGRVLLARRPA
jgi:SAM-dependent methyltransferase